MALPIYPAATVLPFQNPISTLSSQTIDEIFKKHSTCTRAFLRGALRPSPPIPVRYGFTPIPFKPYYTGPFHSLNNMDNRAFPHIVPRAPMPRVLAPTATTINAPMPAAPVPIKPIPLPLSTQSYQAQSMQLKNRHGSAELERSKVSNAMAYSSYNNFSKENDPPIDVIVIDDDEEPSTIKSAAPLSGARMNPLYAGTDPALNPNSPYQQQLLTNPGPGQLYITKIRTLVEGCDTKLSPPRKNSPKAKKYRQKTKIPTTEENPSKKMKTTPETIEAQQTFSPSNRYPKQQLNVSDFLVLGFNGTIISKPFYDTIPWNSYERTIQILLGHYLGLKNLATQSLVWNNTLNPYLIEDIINHVSLKCGVARILVEAAISKTCANESSNIRLP